MPRLMDGNHVHIKRQTGVSNVLHYLNSKPSLTVFSAYILVLILGLFLVKINFFTKKFFFFKLN